MKFKKFHPELIYQYPDVPTLPRAMYGATDKEIEKAIHKVSLHVNWRFIEFMNSRSTDTKAFIRSFKEDWKQAEIVHCLTNESYLICLAVTARYFATAYPKVHVIGPEFFTKFREMNLDKVLCRHIPENAAGYVEFPYEIEDRENKFKGFYYFCGKVGDLKPAFFGEGDLYGADALNPECRCIGVGYYNTDALVSNFIFRRLPEDLDTPLASLFKNTQFHYKRDLGKAKTFIEEDSFHPYNAVILNLIAYLNCQHLDVSTFHNPVKYRGNSTTKLVRADVDYSQADINLVGYEFEAAQRQTHTEEWYSMPHFGWRWYGEGRKLLRLSYVKGATKRRKNFNEAASDGLEASL